MNRPIAVLASISAVVSIAALLAGCGEDATRAQAAGEPPKPGSYQEGGAFTPFYAEEVYDNRLYVFGHKNTWAGFTASHEMDPQKCRRLIGQGPGHMTLLLETTKDEPAMDQRLVATVRNRYSLDIQ